MAQKYKANPQMLSGTPQPNFTGYQVAPIIAQRAPTSMDTGYPLGQDWVDEPTGATYTLGRVSAGVATWNSSSTSGTFTDLTVTGTALFEGPFTVDNANNEINMNSGTGNINISDDDTVTTIDIGTGGATGVKNLSLGSPNGASATTLQAGTGVMLVQTFGGIMNIKSGTGTLSIADDGTAQTVRLGTGAGAKTVVVGSITSTSSTAIQSGTGPLTLTSTNGALTINSGTGALSISNDATQAVVRLGTGAGQKDVQIGSTNTSSSTTITAGTGGIAYTSGQSVSSVGVNGGLSPYTVTAAHELVYVDTGAAVTVNLPASPRPGHHIVVVDATGTANANNITVSGNGNNISEPGGTSAASKTINTEFGSLNMYYNGTIWNAI